MNYIYFYMQFAILQAENWGGAVSIKSMMTSTGYSRSQVNRYLKELIKANFVFKPKRGKYYLVDCRGAQAIGFVTVTPIEMFEYSTRKMRGGVENES